MTDVATDFLGLDSLGFTPHWRELFGDLSEDGFALGRVARVDRGGAVVLMPEPLRAEPAWHLAKVADPSALPVVGDWVAVNADPSLDMALIEAVLPRSSAISRRDPGRDAAAQVLAANVDTLFVTHTLSLEPNLGRIERELALAWESGAQPVVVLTKADVCVDVQTGREQVEAVALTAPVHVVSAIGGTGMDDIRAYATPGRTVALIGPSGVGKSTLVNALLGEERQQVGEVRAVDDKGRHTTIARELLPMPSGGVLIDTPGMRALALWDAEDGIAKAFADVAELAENCRFRDCKHEAEPGCAVREAIESGELQARRLDSYNKLQRELVRLAEQTDAKLRSERKQQYKTVHKALRAQLKRKYGE